MGLGVPGDVWLVPVSEGIRSVGDGNRLPSGVPDSASMFDSRDLLP